MNATPVSFGDRPPWRTVAIGVDNGGTWIRIAATNQKGSLVWSLKKPSPPVEKLPVFLRLHLKRFNGNILSLTVGSRGVWKPAKRQAIARALAGLAKNIVVISDVEAAWRAAFKREGIIVIAGTGSIAYGRLANGRFARAGGLGPEKGDEGSGYWIGKQWTKRRMPVRKVAKQAARVLQKAQHNQPIAKGIINEAHFHLTSLVLDVMRQLHWKKKVLLCMGGGLFSNPWFKRGFLKTAKQRGIPFTPVQLPPNVASIISHART